MSREDELIATIRRAQAELDGLPPVDRMGLREFARAADLSPATASRIRDGHPNTSLGNLKKALPFLGRCPCCGQKMKST